MTAKKTELELNSWFSVCFLFGSWLSSRNVFRTLESSLAPGQPLVKGKCGVNSCKENWLGWGGGGAATEWRFNWYRHRWERVCGWAGGEKREKGRGRGGGKGSGLFSFAYQIQDTYKIKFWSKEMNLGEDLVMIHMHWTCKIPKIVKQFSTRFIHIKSLKFSCKWNGNCSSERILNDLLKNMPPVIILFCMTRVMHETNSSIAGNDFLIKFCMGTWFS